MTTVVSPHVVAAAPRRNALISTVQYAAHDLRRQARMFAGVFFIVFLPAAMYLMFGAMTEYGSIQAGDGNVKGAIMVSMAVYGAIVASTNIAGSAAVEQSAGWGRLLGLTPMTNASYIAAKVLVALGMATLPVVFVFGVGYATGASLGSVANVVLTFVITIVCSAAFALYGLAFGMAFRTESAMGAASGLLVILSFFGNLFTPLTGTLLEIAKFTPMYGIGGLARWPLLEGNLMGGMPGADSDPLWLLIANVVAWTLIFAAVCAVAARRRAHRR